MSLTLLGFAQKAASSTAADPSGKSLIKHIEILFTVVQFSFPDDYSLGPFWWTS